MRKWFFAYGKPWFVASALAVDRLLELGSRPAQTPPPPAQSPSVLYKLYDVDGTVCIAEGIAMTQENADELNRGLAESGQSLRWMSRPPSVSSPINAAALLDPKLSERSTYRLYDIVANKFCEGDPTTMFKEVADEQNKDLVSKNSPFRWIQVS